MGYWSLCTCSTASSAEGKKRRGWKKYRWKYFNVQIYFNSGDENLFNPVENYQISHFFHSLAAAAYRHVRLVSWNLGDDRPKGEKKFVPLQLPPEGTLGLCQLCAAT